VIEMKEQMIAIANKIQVTTTCSFVLLGGINVLESKQ